MQPSCCRSRTDEVGAGATERAFKLQVPREQRELIEGQRFLLVLELHETKPWLDTQCPGDCKLG